jgi:hypothetical protein
LAWRRVRGRPGCMTVVLPKLPVKSEAPRRRSGPGLKEGGKAPPLPSSSLLPISGRQEARCCRCAVDEARCVVPPRAPSCILPHPGAELAVVMNWASCSAVVHLPTKRFFFVRAMSTIEVSKENWQVVKYKRSKLCTLPQSSETRRQQQRCSLYLKRMKRLCFNCLAREHKVASYRSPKRCCCCRQFGHILLSVAVVI